MSLKDADSVDAESTLEELMRQCFLVVFNGYLKLQFYKYPVITYDVRDPFNMGRRVCALL